jgi:myo-inositol-1(or 4)-monophosphatase
MQIDINELIELIKSVKPMFFNHTEAEHVTVKGRADFVTQVDIRVQEYMRKELSKRWPEVQFMTAVWIFAVWVLHPLIWHMLPVDASRHTSSEI